MVKNILGAVAGYVAMFVAIFVLFSLAFMLIGVEGSYQENTYHVSMLWIVVSLLLSFPVGMTGGYVTKMIAGNDKAIKILLGIVVVLGLFMASGSLFVETSEVARPETVGNMEAMMNSIQPLWVGLLVVLMHIAGVLYGARLRKEGVGVTSVT
ncbi:MAG: hypothetical protein R3284_07830 [Rubricoccaceae bacterium]|nr:hypothetical protein [Rubricoccaceae bacterium]